MAQSLEKTFIIRAMRMAGFQFAADAVENNELYLRDLKQSVEQWKRHQTDADTFFDPMINSWYKAATQLQPRTWK